MVPLAIIATSATATSASARDSQYVCGHYTTTGRNYIDSKGNDIYEISYVCDWWLEIGEHGGDDKDHDNVPDNGVDGDHLDPYTNTPEYCTALQTRTNRDAATLRFANDELERTRQNAEDATYSAGKDYADYEAAKEREAEARRALADAKATYAQNHDLDIEIERRNGNTTTTSTPIDISTPEGRAVVGAQADLAKAEREAKAALDRWYASDPEAREAREAYERYRNINETYPPMIEEQRAEIAQHCKD